MSAIQTLRQRDVHGATNGEIEFEILQFLEKHHPVVATEPRESVWTSARNKAQFIRALNSIELELRRRREYYLSHAQRAKEQKMYLMDVPNRSVSPFHQTSYDTSNGMWKRTDRSPMDVDLASRVFSVMALGANKGHGRFHNLPNGSGVVVRGLECDDSIINGCIPKPMIAQGHRFRKFRNDVTNVTPSYTLN